MKYANLQPGQNVLDLGTGTGLIAIKAKEIVGKAGKVYGIDFTPEMLSIAIHKARQARMPINFIRGDINDLDQLKNQIPIKFDVITCAAAFMFIENPVNALKQWSKFLKPGGRIIFDVRPKKAVPEDYALQEAAQQLNLPTFDYQRGLGSASDIDAVIQDAGLEAYTFKSREYMSSVSNIQLGLRGLQLTLETQPFYECLQSPELYEVAAGILIEEVNKVKDSEGRYTRHIWFYVGIATKPD